VLDKSRMAMWLGWKEAKKSTTNPAFKN
jgi:hypothetical protein